VVNCKYLKIYLHYTVKNLNHRKKITSLEAMKFTSYNLYFFNEFFACARQKKARKLTGGISQYRTTNNKIIICTVIQYFSTSRTLEVQKLT